MAMKSSQYPWHIYINKIKDQIILDKTLGTDNEVTYLDLESNSENA